MNELMCDILIVGGGTGGTAAAIAIARAFPDLRVIVTEPTDWIGGQLTAQGVPPDENQWIEDFGGTALYQELRDRVRAWYRANRTLTPKAMSDPRLNPGGGWVSRLCAEPRVWHAVLVEMLAEHMSAGRVKVLLNTHPVSADSSADTVCAMTFLQAGQSPGHSLIVHAKYILDASELGDVLKLANIEHAIGAEHQRVFGELHSRTDFDHKHSPLDPLDQQACSWCFAIEHRPGENHVIAKPKAYDAWSKYVPTMDVPWTGPLFSWTVPSHNEAGRRTFEMIPWPDEPAPGVWEMWRYRRIADATQQLGVTDVALINMVQMDYWQKPLLGVSDAALTIALEEARQQSLCWLYWMQTEAPRHDIRDDSKVGYPGLKLRGAELGTLDGFAKSVYIREARRLVARTIVHEGHMGTEQRRQAGLATSLHNWDATPFGTSERFVDSVGIGHYQIDLHPTCAGRNNVYVPAAPFRVPMGALIPVRVRNVLAAGKCLGVSHIANGAYRMHHVEWNIGESAGLLAAWCITNDIEPAGVHSSADRVRDVQRLLVARGVRIAWPWEA